MPRLRITCPHCKQTLAPGFLRSAVGRLNNAKRAPKGPPKKLKACPHCEKKFGAREIREHTPVCPENPRVKAAIAASGTREFSDSS